MARTRAKMLGRRESGSFVMLPHAIIESENWKRMSPFAVKLFIDLYGQYRGTNNGDFTAAWSVMQPKGWRSKATLQKALQELMWFGMIELTRQGGLNRPSLYGVSFKAIDECWGKLDVPATRVPSRRWATPVGPFPGLVRHCSAKTTWPAHVAGHVGPPAVATATTSVPS
jgi:hypothetical protein